MRPDEQLERIERGTVEIYSREELLAKLSRGRPLVVKLGVDPTAPDLHLGFTIVLRKLRLFQDLGHDAVLIIGDYTGMVGDPSGRDKTRPPLEPEQIRQNARRYLEQAGKVLDESRLRVVYNGEWFSRLTFRQVIELASRLTVARMLERDTFAKRQAQGLPIALHELLYCMMQAYDSVMIGADVELGGTDQTFNLLTGREMQRDFSREPQVCITTPLLVGLDGTLKMSKSYGNTIGIDDGPDEMYGKLMSIPDSLMKEYFTLLTDLPADEIGRMCDGSVHPRQAKAALAADVTARYHGSEAARRAAGEFNKVFRDKETPQDVPEIAVSKDDLLNGRIWIARLIVVCGFARSNAEARRLVEQGGVSLDGARIADPTADIEIRDGSLLKVGKRHFARLRTGP